MNKEKSNNLTSSQPINLNPNLPTAQMWHGISFTQVLSQLSDSECEKMRQINFKLVQNTMFEWHKIACLYYIFTISCDTCRGTQQRLDATIGKLTYLW